MYKVIYPDDCSQVFPDIHTAKEKVEEYLGQYSKELLEYNSYRSCFIDWDDNECVLSYIDHGYIYNSAKICYKTVKIEEYKTPPPLPKRKSVVVCEFCEEDHKTDMCPHKQFHNYSNIEEDKSGEPYNPRYYVWI